MNLRFLETFVWVARLHSFTQAAERLNTTQAAVSQRIAGLEDTLGTKLFVRENRSVELTRTGTRILEQAEQLLQLYQGMQDIAIAKTSQRKLYLGCTEAVSMTFMPELCNLLNQELEDTIINVDVDLSNKVNSLLLNEEVDYVLSQIDSHAPSIVSVPLCDFELKWLANPNLPLPPGALTYDQLAQFPIITHPKGSMLHEIVSGKIDFSQSSALRIQMSSGATAMLRLAIETPGICLMAPTVARKEILEGKLRIVEVDEQLPFARVYVSYLDKRPKQFSRLITKLCQRAISSFSRTGDSTYFRYLPPDSGHVIEV